ncbi:MAG: hypothetical protein ABI542_05670 [Gemmatimonadota bacterium]
MTTKYLHPILHLTATFRWNRGERKGAEHAEVRGIELESTDQCIVGARLP